MSYVLSVDQSTQGTKALLFDPSGKLICRRDVAHEQKINSKGWVSHDPEEIYRNTVESVRQVLEAAGIDAGAVAALGISNQRETSVCWEKETGRPIADAIVWQCGRAKELCKRVEDAGWSEAVRSATGIPISPFFPASKFAWLVENTPGAAEKAKEHKLCFGTIDAWLVYKLTGGRSYKTDYSNASRTQLFNIHTLQWDEQVCAAFGLNPADLPEVASSDAWFGMTDIGGVLPHEVPICGVLGDSHAALFGQGCLRSGMAKATYGTGSSIMMNIGITPIESRNGLVTSLAWKFRGEVNYVMEGNLNYTGAVLRWLEKDLGLCKASETQALAESASPEDTTYLVPAFTGLGAPYWNNEAKAMLCGITRLTGKAEIARAALDCIAYQITDIVEAMQKDTGLTLTQLQVDGGPTRNGYLMQLQSDLLNAQVRIPSSEELSGIGAAYMAGLTAGVFTDAVFDTLVYSAFSPKMDGETRKEKYTGWQDAVRLVLGASAQ